VENVSNTIKGRGAQVNTESRFIKQQLVTEHIEGLDEELELSEKTQIFYEHPRKIINKVDSPDLMGWSMNPYQGCEHGCIYCYARNTHQYWGYSAGLDWEQKIIVKANAAELLEKEFMNKKWEPSPIMFSGNTDCYQPLERKMIITRKMLEVCLRFKNPVSMITKNALILRDVDILSEMAKLRLAHVAISITSLDEDLRLKMEPRTATAKNRLKVIEQLSKAGIPVMVMAAPIIPGLNSHEVPHILEAAAAHGASGAGFTIVRLNGALGNIFTDWIQKSYPDKAEKVLNLIKGCHGGQLNDSRFGTRMRGEGNVAESIRQLFKTAKKKYFKNKDSFDFDLTLFERPNTDKQMSLF
jgi:DNA repair photolyase